MPDASFLKGKTAWITGGGSGIGLAGGLELARMGARIVISGRSQETLAAAEKAIKAVGSCEAIALDVGNKPAVAKAAERIGHRRLVADVESTEEHTSEIPDTVRQ